MEVELEQMGGFGNPTDADQLLNNHHHQHAGQLPAPAATFTTEITEVGNQHADIESGSLACCRICLEDAEDDSDLISPCMCRGTQQFVHRSCLNHWRSVKEGFAFTHCTTCKAQFHLRVAEVKISTCRKIKFRLFVARDIVLVFLAIQLVIGILGAFAYLVDKGGKYKDAFNDRWDRILLRDPIPFYYCAGVLAFFVLLGVLVLVVNCAVHVNDQRVAGCQNCFYAWGILDCFPVGVETVLGYFIVYICIFAILGIAYGFLASTVGIQRIWQRHYHILTKKQLTQEYIVEDLHGSYTPPTLESELEERLKKLKLL